MSKFRVTRHDRLAQKLLTESFMSEQDKWEAFQATLEEDVDLTEADEAPAFPRDATDHDVNDSIDSQVDRFLSEFETTARGDVNESVDIKLWVEALLREAGEDDEADTDVNDEPDEEMKPSDIPLNDDKPQLQGIDSINVEAYANEVARLVENFESLLEIKNTVLRRAQKHLAKAFSPDVIESFNDAMQENHGMVIGQSKMDDDEDGIGVHPAVGAGPDVGEGPAGAGGGGGAP